MPRPRRRTLPSLLVSVAALANVAHSQLPKHPHSQPPLQPLGDVLHLVFDQDKDQRVTRDEVDTQLAMLGVLLSNGEGAEAVEYCRLLAGVQGAAPTLFDLLDANGDGALSKAELKFATRFEAALAKDGGMRELLRDLFEILDADGDSRLSAAEVVAGSQSDAAIRAAAGKVHALFPLRDTPAELEGLVKGVMASISGGALDEEGVADAMAWLDDDGDGYVQRAEVGRHYNAAGREFLKIAKTIKQMGPMMAMFGGVGANGGGGPGGFKMDL